MTGMDITNTDLTSTGNVPAPHVPVLVSEMIAALAIRVEG